MNRLMRELRSVFGKPTPAAARTSETHQQEVRPRVRLDVTGRVVAILVRPRSDGPRTVSVDVALTHAQPPREYDRIRLMWLGRPEIPGLTVGAWVRASGIESQTNNKPCLFNPRYDLLPDASGSTAADPAQDLVKDPE